MRGKLVRYFAIALISIVAAMLVAALFVYASNMAALDHIYPVANVSIAAVSGADAVQRGKHLADVTGCTDCHRADLRGGLFDDEGAFHGRYYASNLTLKAKRYSDADIARIVRVGVSPDGRGVVAMPSFAFVRLTDGEMADINAFIRSLPAGGEEPPPHYVGPIDQWKLWRGEGPKVAISYVDGERVKQPVDAGSDHEAGRHLAGIVCAECHGGDLKGNGWDSGAPDLLVIQSYGFPEFKRLVQTGTGVGGRTLAMMSEVARGRLHHLSDPEIAEIYAYLVARAKLPAR